MVIVCFGNVEVVDVVVVVDVEVVRAEDVVASKKRRGTLKATTGDARIFGNAKECGVVAALLLRGMYEVRLSVACRSK